MADNSDPDKEQQPESTLSAGGSAAVGEVLRQVTAKPGIARGLAGLARMNQPGGFDCPGCAWPEDPRRRKFVDFCENGTKAFADEATRKHIDAAFFERYSIADLAARADGWLNARGRLTRPVIRRPGATHYQPITWVSAYQLIAKHLGALDDPNQAAFYTSGRTSNEAAFLWQLFARSLGTNNLPDCSNLCHESSGTALKAVIGSGKGTVRLADFDAADAIFVLGQNPGSNHPRMLTTLQRAKQRGAVIVSINPLDEVGLSNFKNPQTVRGWVGKGESLCDLHVPVRINGDVAFLQGLSKALIEADSSRGGVLDHAFINAHTAGFDAFRTAVEQASWDAICAASGVPRDTIEQAAEIAANADSTICCWAMGLTQHENAVANVQEIVNFLLLRGNFGRPGAGACPIRGHSNVQGDRTMGIWEKPDAAFLDALGREFRFTPPAEHGLDTVNTLKAMAAGKVRVFMAMGGNFIAASPDTGFANAAIERCELTVQVSTKLNRSHVMTGQTALILPALGRTETDIQEDAPQFVTVEDSMGVITKSRGRLAPASTYLKSEVRIVAELADVVLGDASRADWLRMANDYDLIRDRIERVIPGFEDFNDRLIEASSFELPHAVRDELRFDTAADKALFTVHPLPPHELVPGQFLMMTIRSHDQFNTTVYSNRDRYRGITDSRWVVFMNAEDVAGAGLAAGVKVSLTSHFGEQRRTLAGFAVVPYQIPRGCIATYFPEANPLIPVGHVASGSNTPAYKSVIVSLSRTD